MLHVGLWHCPLVDLVPPEHEDWDTIPQTTVYVYQIVCLKLLTSLLLLGSTGKPLLDEKSGPLGEVLGVLVPEGAKQKGATATRMI